MPADQGGPAGQDAGAAAEDRAGGAAGLPGGAVLPVLPDPAPRDGERALARFGLLGEGAAPVFIPGARYPLAGLLLALPAAGRHRAAGLRPPGLRPAAGRVLQPGHGAGAPGAPGAAARAPRRGRLPRPAARDGPGPGPGPGAGSQDDPPQARRARRRRQGRGPADGDRQMARRGAAGPASGSSASTGTPGRTSASGTCRRCTWPG